MLPTDYKDRFKSLFQGVIDIISLIDTNYTILMVNKAYEGLLNKNAHECIGKKCYRIIRNRETPCEDCPILNGAETDKGIVINIGNDEVLIKRHPVYNENGILIGVYEIGRVITKQLRMERELEHHGRLKIMGELAVSIAHEIKNPLAGIGLMSVSIMERLEQRESKDEIYSDMGSILTEVQRLEKLLESLSDFGKPSLFSKKRGNIHVPLNETIKLLEERFRGGNITLKKEFNHRIPDALIDGAKMQQVFLNVLLNAIEATPNGGEILIKTGASIAEGEEGMRRKGVTVTIEDNGMGIKREDMPYIFDPFFSRSRHNTGLGLSIVLRIIDLHNGSITIQSDEGKGTTVVIYLPAYTK